MRTAFFDDKDRLSFLTTLDEVCSKTAWQVHAYCLMGNHFHLVVHTPTANLVTRMKWFLGTYTSRSNRRYKLFDHLFSGRYKALIVDGGGTGYLRTLCDYVHLIWPGWEARWGGTWRRGAVGQCAGCGRATAE